MMWRWLILGAVVWATTDVLIVWALTRARRCATPHPDEMAERLARLRRQGF